MFLYQAYAAQQAALTPWRMLAGLAGAAGAGVGAAVVPPSTVPAGWSEMWEALWSVVADSHPRHDRPAFDLEPVRIGDERVVVQEEIVHRYPFANLLHFQTGHTAACERPRVLIAAALSGHFATLMRDTVAALLPEHDVYITDWHNARDVPLAVGRFTLDDQIRLLCDAIRRLGPDTQVLAVSQSAISALAATALLSADAVPCPPASLILMNGPVDARINPTAVGRLAAAQPLDLIDSLAITTVPAPHAGQGRRVFPGFLQLSGFLGFNLSRHIAAHLDFYRRIALGDHHGTQAARRVYIEYLTVMDVPAEFYLQTVASTFQNFALAAGTLRVQEQPVEMAAIRQTALLTVEGGRDEACGPGQTRAAHDLCSSLPATHRQHITLRDAGHFGVFTGRRWRQHIAPEVAAFIRRTRT
jgi:poly(3-hydroxybutyrate) depolymerase